MRGLTAPAMADRPSEDTQASTWEQLWFTLTQGDWASLALVPVSRGASAVAVARALADAGQRFKLETIDVIDAGQAVPGDVPALVASLEAGGATGRRVLIAVGPPLLEPSAIPIARSADTAVLLVGLDRSEVARARQTMAYVGEAHFAGSIALKG